jgi:hypothetical protein
MTRHIELARTLGVNLQGRLLGRKHYGQICEILADAPAGGTIILDFHKVEIMTGSWANEMIVPLYRWAADPGNDLFPILLNVADGWDEELQLLAQWNHQCYVLAEGRKWPPVRAVLIGSLDLALRKTLEAVIQFGEITGAELERRNPQAGVGATAWNNRLRDLHVMRLVARSKRGREQLYSPIIKEILTNG